MPAHDKGVLIKQGAVRDNGGQFRGRDLEFELKGVEIDPRLKAVLYKMAEQEYVNMKSIAELAAMFDQMIDTMKGITEVAENMKGHVEKFQRGYGEDAGQSDV